jgi:hypothetical protein
MLKVSFEGKSIKNVHRPLSAKGVVFSLHLFFWGDLLGVDLSHDQKRSSSEDEDDRKENASSARKKRRIEKNRSSSFFFFFFRYG